MVAVVVYLPYPLIAVASGNGRLFFSEKASGGSRFIGAVQTTGFNAHGSSSFVDKLVDQIPLFGASYILLALGAAAVVVLWRRGGSKERVVAAWLGSAYPLGAFSVVQGTLEEQLFYFLAVPATVAVPVALALLVRSGDTQRRPVSASLAVATLGLIVGIAALSWTSVRQTPDDSERKLVSFAQHEFEPTDVVASTSDTEQFVLTGVRLETVDRFDDLSKKHVDYVVIRTKNIEDGTATVSEAFLAQLDTTAAVVFSVDGPSVGQLRVYRL